MNIRDYLTLHLDTK